MALENIVRNVIRSVRSNPLCISFITISYGLANFYAVSTLKDGFDKGDDKALAISAAALSIATLGVMILQKWHDRQYNEVKELIESNGLDIAVRDKSLRRFVRYYAEDNDILEEYNLALNRYKHWSGQS